METVLQGIQWKRQMKRADTCQGRGAVNSKYFFYFETNINFQALISEIDICSRCLRTFATTNLSQNLKYLSEHDNFNPDGSPSQPKTCRFSSYEIGLSVGIEKESDLSPCEFSYFLHKIYCQPFVLNHFSLIRAMRKQHKK